MNKPMSGTDNGFFNGIYKYAIYDRDAMGYMEEVRAATLQFAQTIQGYCPNNRFRAEALSHIEEALMRATQSIAFGYGERIPIAGPQNENQEQDR